MNVIDHLFWYFFVGTIGCFGAIFNDREYYLYKLKLPKNAPRPFWFGIVWPILYALQALACELYQYYNDVSWDTTLTLFVVFSGVSGIFTLVFFYFKSLWISLFVMISATGLSITTCYYFFAESTTPVSGFLFLPTVLWIIFATYLMANIVALNTPFTGFGFVQTLTSGTSSSSSSNNNKSFSTTFLDNHSSGSYTFPNLKEVLSSSSSSSSSSTSSQIQIFIP